MKNNAQTQVNMEILDRIAGTGKTQYLIDTSIGLALHGQPVLIVQETKKLIKETAQRLQNKIDESIELTGNDSYKGLLIKQCHNEADHKKVVDQVKDFLSIDATRQTIMFVTKETFLELRLEGYDFHSTTSMKSFKNTNAGAVIPKISIGELYCFWDEFLEPFEYLEPYVETTHSKQYLNRLMVIEDEKVGVFQNWDKVHASDVCICDHYKNPNDYLFKGLKNDGVIRALLGATKGFTEVYINKKRDEIAYRLQPSLFECFFKTEFIGAKYEFHEMAWFWSDVNIPAVDPNTGNACRVKNYESLADITIWHFNEFYWSTNMKKEPEIIDPICFSLNEMFAQQERDYLLSETEEIYRKKMFKLNQFKLDDYTGVHNSYGAKRIGTKCAGVNEYRQDNAAAFLSSMTRPEGYYNAVLDLFLTEEQNGKVSITEDSIDRLAQLELDCNIAYYAYQFFYRINMRIKDYDGRIDLVCGTKQISDRIVAMLSAVKPVKQERINRHAFNMGSKDDKKSMLFAHSTAVREIMMAIDYEERKQQKEKNAKLRENFRKRYVEKITDPRKKKSLQDSLKKLMKRNKCDSNTKRMSAHVPLVELQNIEAELRASYKNERGSGFDLD
ncbi:hypothetical protein [Vibrio harveyi]|uniref:hypothetical protein n=1 Tax=Vibrio harveyi TaxID=669 RepID=UPI0012630DF7|nr:hypothetical protein [Vibrio harveyi]QFQ76876.1 hypothetical protein F9277_05105 [Vibrio harveyi]